MPYSSAFPFTFTLPPPPPPPTTRPPTATSTASSGTPAVLQAIKICAVTTPDDAHLVCRTARQILPSHTTLLLGMILWPHSRRSVTLNTARKIAAVAHEASALPVAVFVDEDPSTIQHTCTNCDIPVAQLHGPASRAHWTTAAASASSGGGDNDGSAAPLSWIDVRDVCPSTGVVSPATSTNSTSTLTLAHEPLWTIFDAKGGGTGTPFHWASFQPPVSTPPRPWLLAGGLDPDNVTAAINALRPAGLDVATGVTGPDKCKKDAGRLEAFLQRAVDAYD